MKEVRHLWWFKAGRFKVRQNVKFPLFCLAWVVSCKAKLDVREDELSDLSGFSVEESGAGEKHIFTTGFISNVWVSANRNRRFSQINQISDQNTHMLRVFEDPCLCCTSLSNSNGAGSWTGLATNTRKDFQTVSKHLWKKKNPKTEPAAESSSSHPSV